MSIRPANARQHNAVHAHEYMLGGMTLPSEKQVTHQNRSVLEFKETRRGAS